jgi:hypothetical protein
MGFGSLYQIEDASFLTSAKKRFRFVCVGKAKTLYLFGIALDSRTNLVGQADFKRCGFQLGNHAALLLLEDSGGQGRIAL